MFSKSWQTKLKFKGITSFVRMEKNLVLTLGTNYKLYQIESFFKSLRSAGYKGDIVLFYNNLGRSVLKKLRSYGVNLIKFNKNVFVKKRIHLMNYRFKLFHDFLVGSKDVYNKVLITDLRDVVFQKDPFDYPDYSKINYFYEDRKIRDSNINSYVVKQASNVQTYNKISQKNIICAGTTIGNSREIINYLKIMSKKLTESRIPIDQGYHNIIFHTKKISGSKGFFNYYGPVLTLSDLKINKEDMDQKGRLINKDRSIINIVHQYDRSLYLLYKYSSFPNFIKLFLKFFYINLRRAVKIMLFNFPFVGRSFRNRYFDPTRFD